MHINFELGSHSSPPPQSLRIAVAGGFTNTEDAAQPLSVDKDSFKEVISKHAGELLFEVSNHLASHPKQLLIKLQIKDLTSFAPVGLAAQVPELGRSFEFRDRLAALAQGSLSHDQFEAGLHDFSGLDTFTEVVQLCRQASQASASKGDANPPTSSSSVEPV